MAASPVPNNNKVLDSLSTSATINGNGTSQKSTTSDTPKTNLRGLNKPKCIKCGNVARSRCPFHCCKSCCAKAQNPCYIHVLKPHGTLPDKPSPSSTAPAEQPPSEVASSGASWRLSALRQFSTNYLSSLRAKKTLSWNDAININKWRFSKLREYIEGNIEVENEAFERYINNAKLLEETFAITEDSNTRDSNHEEASSNDTTRRLISEIKVKIKSSPVQEESFRENMRNLVDRKLKELNEKEFINDEFNTERHPKRVKMLADKNAAVYSLIDKMNKARNEEDLGSCLHMKLQLFDTKEEKLSDSSHEQSGDKILSPKQELDASSASSSYSLPKICTVVYTDEANMSKINEVFSSIGQTIEL